MTYEGLYVIIGILVALGCSVVQELDLDRGMLGHDHPHGMVNVMFGIMWPLVLVGVLLMSFGWVVEEVGRGIAKRVNRG